MMKLRQYHFSWLVAMAAGVAMTAMTACSSEKELTETPIVEQPAQPTAKGVKVTVTAGISDGAQTRSAVTDGAATRSEVAEGTDELGKTTRTLKFTGPKGTEGAPDYEPGDRLYVWKVFGAAQHLAGMLTMVGEPSADGTSATFTGELMAYDSNGNEVSYSAEDDPLEDSEATLVHAGLKEETVDNTGYSIESNGREIMFSGSAADVETLMTTWLLVKGTYTSGSGYSLASISSIINCSLSGLAASTEYTAALQYPDNSSNCVKGHGWFTTDASGAGTVAFAGDNGGTHDWQIVIKKGTTEVGTIDLGTKELTAKVYNVKRNYGRAAFGKFVDISTLSADFEAQDGDVLSGTLANNVKISIAAGATVTLSGARINDNDAGTDRQVDGEGEERDFLS